MAYDEGLAERMREALAEELGVVEKRMFGGIAFMVRGHMSAGIIKDEIMVRVGPDAYAALVRQKHARAMDFTGRPMVGYLFVGAAGVAEDGDLRRWIGHGVAFARSLPEKKPKEPKAPLARGRRPAAPRAAASRKRR